ncbi:MBL fold metallo-hydrolase [Hyphomicrobium sp. xq]|uniref:Linear primary-alkylsulfatase n=1 Tax=Hyphomicrobium album TaxID=2665159 RepID=A0A6I3KDJ1_9HYPH|nr:alkyl sulfatase dimerization domain-containing protein [Hyphomicrobium album]MTD93565.1 MBL fold metallo-hydrolase [Hyphomicrobium album]
MARQSALIAGAATALICALIPIASLAQTQSKPASEATKAANAAVLNSLPFSDKQDFEDAQRGFVARPEKLTIKDAKGNVVWDLEQYKTYIGDDKPAPDSVNPSLWRNAQLGLHYGLFKVTDRIYQVRGYDLSVMTFIQGDTGWIVGDPLISTETAKAAYDLVSENLGKKPVVAVIYSHSHVDHYGGVRGIVDENDVKSGKVRIIAPEGFTEEAVSENVIAGNAMSRRAIYMYGALLPRSPVGGVSGGLGPTTSTGTATLIVPSETISKTGTKLTIDGIDVEFQMTPGTEAPSEMNTFFSQFKAMWMAENTTHTLHNLLTLRGAKVRDAAAWARFLQQTIDMFGPNIDVEFASHHWPMWGHERIIDYLKKQRDLYKYIHDQSVRLMNEGYTGVELSNMIKLPKELDQSWFNRGYYGTVKHNSRAVYQRYMGFYDANPTTLDELPPEEAAVKYVEYMGGAPAIIAKAKGDFDKGQYRWVAMALKNVVFADPSNKEAKELLADAYEQMGYQAESGPWRSVYLQGAYELRHGVPNSGGIDTASPDTIKAMSPELLFDYLGVRLNGPKAEGKKIGLNINFTDLNKKYALFVENGTLNYSPKFVETPDAMLTLTKNTLDSIQLKTTTIDDAIAAGDLKVEGNKQSFSDFLGLLDTYPFWFNIVTP